MRAVFFRELFCLLMVLPLGFSACTRSASPENDIKTSSSGYVCPTVEIPVKVESTELNLLARAGYIPRDMIECFELVYNAKVNLYQYSSNEEMYVKIAAGGIEYDLAQPSSRIVPLLVRERYLQELDHSRLPVLANIDPNYLDLAFDPENRFTIPYQSGADAIVVNTSAVTSPPRSWADLWNNEYVGRMVFLDDGRAVIGLTLLVLGYDINTTNIAHLEEARNKLMELAPNIKFFDSDSPKTALIAGDVDLGVIWTPEAFIARQKKDEFEFIYPTEGAILWQNTWAILRDAPHTDAAYAWINYTMQANLFWMVLRDFPCINPNIAALEYVRENKPELYFTYMNSPITNPPLEVIQNGHYIEDVGKTTTLYDNIWVEIKGGN